MRFLIAIVLLVFLSSCNKSKSHEEQSSNQMLVAHKTKVDVNFAGYDRGCKKWYNPIFCEDKYKPKSSLASGIGGPDQYEIYVKDKDGKIIILDRNQTEFLLNLKRR